MELSDRKKRILCAVITDYVRSAEPVGSKAIAENYGLGLSSATIRNELAELAEMGLIEQPHTSAGRVPSELGYRIYFDGCLQSYRLTPSEMRRINDLLSQCLGAADTIISEIGKHVSSMLKLATVVTAPKRRSGEIRRFSIVYVDRYSFILVIILTAGSAKSRSFRSSVPLEEPITAKLEDTLNRWFSNREIGSITLENILAIRGELAEYDFVLIPILNFVYDTLESLDEEELFVEGAARILEYPEFKDASKVKDLFGTLENEAAIRRLLEESYKSGSGSMKVLIGKENPEQQMRESGMVISCYSVGGHSSGAIAVIGPTRMDYTKIAAQLDYISSSLSKLLSDIFPADAE